MNILFVCSKNLSRSPTAEMIYKDHSGLNVKSAGTESSTGAEQFEGSEQSTAIELTAENINWSDLIFAMEEKHKQTMIEKFPFEIKQKKIIVLGIQDKYKFMDDELIEEIKIKVNKYIDK
jgi:protein-tyrosine phosphatase